MSLLVATINGVAYNLPTPAPENYQYQTTHLENSFVDARGYLHRDIIRYNRAKIFCGWNALTSSDISLLQRLYDVPFFYLTCTDNHNNRVTKKVYAGPLDSKAFNMDNTTLDIKYRTGTQMNFIEY